MVDAVLIAQVGDIIPVFHSLSEGCCAEMFMVLTSEEFVCISTSITAILDSMNLRYRYRCRLRWELYIYVLQGLKW